MNLQTSLSLLYQHTTLTPLSIGNTNRERKGKWKEGKERDAAHYRRARGLITVVMYSIHKKHSTWRRKFRYTTDLLGSCKHALCQLVRPSWTSQSHIPKDSQQLRRSHNTGTARLSRDLTVPSGLTVTIGTVTTSVPSSQAQQHYRSRLHWDTF